MLQVWRSVLGGVEKTAGAHEMISQTLQTDIHAQLKGIKKTQTERRANILQEVAKQDEALAKEMKSLDKIRKKYDKVEADSDAAEAAYEKAERNDAFDKKKVEKARIAWVNKSKVTDSPPPLTHSVSV